MNIKKSIQSVIAIVVTTLYAPFSLAQDSPWFVNASLGQTTLEQPSENSAEDEALGDYESLSWALGVGYSINKYIAIEVAYEDLGKFDVVRDICADNFVCVVGYQFFSLSRRGVSVTILPSWSVSERIDLYGKLGYRQLIQTGSESDAKYGDDNEHVLGLGALFKIGHSANIYGEAQFLEDQNVFKAGVRLRF